MIWQDANQAGVWRFHWKPQPFRIATAGKDYWAEWFIALARA